MGAKIRPFFQSSKQAGVPHRILFQNTTAILALFRKTDYVTRQIWLKTVLKLDFFKKCIYTLAAMWVKYFCGQHRCCLRMHKIAG
jgi:hypothetical protein